MGGGATTATRGGGGAGGAGGAVVSGGRGGGSGGGGAEAAADSFVASRDTVDGRHCARTTGTPPATASANANHYQCHTTVHLPLLCGVCLSDVETLADGRRGADVEV